MYRIALVLLTVWMPLGNQQSMAQSLTKPASAYQAVAEDGAWCWFSDPRAVYYKGEQERIYYGYINSRGDVMIGARNVKSKAIETYMLHEKLQIDDHNVPAILFLPDGKILTFYTEHNGRFFMRKSKNATDITSWEEEKVISFGMGKRRICYSHPVMLSGENNRIYMFFRAQETSDYESWRQYLSYSDDYGNTWSEGQSYLDTKVATNPIYLKVSSDNKSRVDFVFGAHPKIVASSIHHMYYENGKFYQTNGNFIAGIKDIPLAVDKINKVYDVTKTNVKSWIWDLALGKDGKPVIAYAQYPDETDHRYHYTRWNGKKWIDEEICKAGGMITVVPPGKKILEAHYSGGIVLDHNNPSEIYLSREINGIFEIEHRVLNGRKWKMNNITTQSKESNIRPYVVSNYTGKDAIVMWMNGLYNHYTAFKTVLRINEPADR